MGLSTLRPTHFLSLLLALNVAVIGIKGDLCFTSDVSAKYCTGRGCQPVSCNLIRDTCEEYCSGTGLRSKVGQGCCCRLF